jgi:hypothetical protein
MTYEVPCCVSLRRSKRPYQKFIEKKLIVFESVFETIPKQEREVTVAY